jgi:ABC-2 type transport system permease protein
MIPFLAVIKKELGSVLRDRTILIAILLQLFIASFSSGLLLGMLSLYDSDTIMRVSGAAIRMGVVNAEDNQLAVIMMDHGLRVTSFETLVEAETAFYAGSVNAIADTPQDVNGITELKLYLPNSDTISSLIRMVIQEPLKQYENYLRTQKGIDTHYTDLQGEPSTSFEFIYSVLLPILMFFPAFVAGSMSIDSLTEEIENDTLQTLLSAPITVNGMVSAKIVSVIILSSLQCATWLVLLKLNGIVIQNAGWRFLLATIISGIISTSATLGAILLRDRERSQFIYAIMLLASMAISNLLNLSPITTLSRLAIGDHYISGWIVMLFAVVLLGLYLSLQRISRRILV